MQKRYDHIIVDTNNMFHANHHAFSHLTHTVGKANLITGGIWGSIKAFDRLRERFLSKDGTIWALFDNAKSKSNMRRKIDPDYKMNRKKMPTSFYRALDYFRMILLHHTDGDYVVYETGYESDDIVPVILSKIPTDVNVLLVSEDLDWSRLIAYQKRPIDQYMKKQVFDKSTFHRIYGFLPSEDRIILYKVIRGDSVDNIPKGVERMPSKILLRLLDDCKDVFEVKENLEILPYMTDTWKSRILQNFPRLRLNHQLVSFLHLTERDIDDYIYPCSYRSNYLKVMYESLGFDIEKIDMRVAKQFHKDRESFDNFWTKPSFGRK